MTGRTPDAPIRVGIIGASADPFQWGSAAHVPALRALPEYELVAVAATRQETADAAARAHDIPMAFGDPRALVAHPAVDLVCVVTSVLHHHDLAMLAIEAGKHVFSEWPLGVDTAQAVSLRDRARARGVSTAVGLQGRCAPIVRHVRALLEGGYVGEIQSVNLSRSIDQHARMVIPESYLYFLDAAKCDSGVTIMAGHVLDTLAGYVGELRDLQAYGEVMMKKVTVAETGATFMPTTPDHVLVQGRLASGAVVTAHMKQNSPVDRAFHLEIGGSSGGLIVTSGERLDPSTRHPGIPSELELYGAPSLEESYAHLDIPAHRRTVPSDTPDGQPFAMAMLYRDFAEALRSGRKFELDFAHAVRRHRLLDTVRIAAERGVRVSVCR